MVVSGRLTGMLAKSPQHRFNDSNMYMKISDVSKEEESVIYLVGAADSTCLLFSFSKQAFRSKAPLLA